MLLCCFISWPVVPPITVLFFETQRHNYQVHICNNIFDLSTKTTVSFLLASQMFPVKHHIYNFVYNDPSKWLVEGFASASDSILLPRCGIKTRTGQEEYCRHCLRCTNLKSGIWNSNDCFRSTSRREKKSLSWIAMAVIGCVGERWGCGVGTSEAGPWQFWRYLFGLGEHWVIFLTGRIDIVWVQWRVEDVITFLGRLSSHKLVLKRIWALGLGLIEKKHPDDVHTFMFPGNQTLLGKASFRSYM